MKFLKFIFSVFGSRNLVQETLILAKKLREKIPKSDQLKPR